MSFFKPQESETQEFMLEKIKQFTEQIMLKSEKVYFQRAHDYVFKLCQLQKQQQLLQAVYSSMRKTLPQLFDSLQVKSQAFLWSITQLLMRIQKNVKTVKDMCLYIDHSYFKDPKQKIIYKLNKIFLQELFKKQQVIAELGKNMAKIHIQRNDNSLENIVKTIKTIDSQEEYFVYHFVQYYLPVLVENMSKQAEISFNEAEQNKNIEAYIQFSHQKLELQEKFLNKFWPDNKNCQNNKSYIMRQLYNVLVSQYKAKIYQNHKEKLFNQFTLQILELFKYNPGSNDVEKHAEWYNGQIKNKLETLKLHNNTIFINSFCQFYNNIMALLEKTHNKFDIHYRSRFAFQEWINEEKLQMPARLNDYIKQYCLGKFSNNVESNDKKIQENIGIVFVLMKQKNLFQKTYRRQLIDRLLENFGEYNMARQQQVIKLMEKQCSEQFVKNIQPIVASYISPLSQETNKQKHQNNVKLNTFLLNSQNWPYDQKHITDITIDSKLLAVVQKETLKFNTQNKDKTLYWHPIIGIVIMKMNFMESKWEGDLILNTCMANVILNFTKTSYQPFDLKTFCLTTGYKPDQLYESIKKILFIKLLINKGTEDNYILAINENFAFPQDTCNILNVQTTNKFESKPLEELKADRKFMVEAIIVKLMKKLKLTDKETILKQTAPLIEKRGFSYNAKFVQSAIDRLVDKEFIRDYEDGKFGYIA